MNKNNEEIENIIKQLIGEILSITKPNSNHWNERYLHHRFSYLVQKGTDYKINLSNEESTFHPEWATTIKKRDDEPDGGVYRDGGIYALGSNGYYEPREKLKEPKKNDLRDNQKETDYGSSGFIDFTIGNYNEPLYAIEFKMAKSMDAKGFVFDYMKLLDSRNKIKEGVISLSVVLGRKTKLEVKDLDGNLKLAKEKLGEYLTKPQDRKVLFYVIQINEGEQPCEWKCENIETGFKQI